MTPERSPGRVRYVPALDGIRGLLLPGVILIHFMLLVHYTYGFDRGSVLPIWLRHSEPFELNIEMFFVLSGALITSLLVTEQQRTGAVSLRQFYLRRFRRLGPALIVVLVLMAAAELLWKGTSALSPLGSHPWLALGAVTAFLGNWVLFRINGGIGWLGPAWTLGIEEQFYLTWPILLRTALKRQLSRRVMLAGFAAATFLSVAMASALYHRYGGARTYYASPTQLPSILCGCALGYELTVNPAGRLAGIARSSIAGVVGLVGTIVATIELGPRYGFAYRGGYLIYALFACLLVGHCMVRVDGTLVTKVLAWRPFVVVGKISYEAYLIHIIVMFAVAQAFPGLYLYRMLALDLAIVVGLSAAFYYLVEQPIRREGWMKFAASGRSRASAGPRTVAAAYSRRPLAVAGVALAGVAAIVMAGVIVVGGSGSGAPSGAGQTAAAPVAGTTVPSAPTSTTSPGVPAATEPGVTGGVAIAPVTGAASPSAPAVLLSDPEVDRITPRAGPLAGGTTVTLSGHHLDLVSGVMFGGVAARSFRLISPSRLVAVVPATDAVSRVAITVVTAAGRQVRTDTLRFAYLPIPTISGLMPAIGPLSGGTDVLIHGTGFARGVKVFFGSLRIPGLHRLSNTTLELTAPPARLVVTKKLLRNLTQLPVSVTVRTAGGTTVAGLTNHFTYL